MAVVAIIGAVLVVAGVLSIRSHKKFMDKAVQAEGEITEVKSERRSSTDEDGYTTNYTVYVPIIKFTHNEKEYSFKSAVSSQSKRKYKVGNSMTIFFDPTDPEKAKVKSVMSNVIVPIIIIIAGVMMVIIGLGNIAF